MIWDLIEQSTFARHFSKPNLALEQLLVDENLLTQMINLNPDLLEYINKNLDSVVEKLIDYVIVMPKLEQGEQRCFKLPYVSSEVLAIGNEIFYNSFFQDNSEGGQQSRFLFKLFGFLKTQAVDNELLMGYFQKVVNNLQRGRQADFTRFISQNIHMFNSCLHLQTIGNLLKSCVILGSEEREDNLYAQRKRILCALVHGLIIPSIPGKQAQVRLVCGGGIAEILRRHKTFNMGTQLISYLFDQCPQLLAVYGMTGINEITQFLICIMTASLQKIYNADQDAKIKIFRLPSAHEKLISGYIHLRLLEIKQQPKITMNPIRQQNGKNVSRLPRLSLDFLTLLALTLQNQIDWFLLQNSSEDGNSTNFENILNFCFTSMRDHPRNDIFLVVIVRIFKCLCGQGSGHCEQIRQLLLEKWNLAQKICDIFQNSEEQRLLRPHIMQIWAFVKNWVQCQDPRWQKVCEVYTPLHTLWNKVAGLNYTRPTNIRLVIDETESTKQTTNKSFDSFNQRQISESIEQVQGNLLLDSNEIKNPDLMNNLQNETKQFYDISVSEFEKDFNSKFDVTPEMDLWMQSKSTSKNQFKDLDAFYFDDKKQETNGKSKKNETTNPFFEFG